MANIIYYLGAGASANAIPTVAEMVDRMGLFAFALEKHYMDLQKSGASLWFDKHGDKYEGGYGRQTPSLEETIEILKDFIEELKKRRSIDTYAKELHIRNDPKEKEELNRLKRILHCYLNWEEIFTDGDLNVVLSPARPKSISTLIRENHNFNPDANIDDKNNIFYEYYKKFVDSLKKEILGDKYDGPKDTLKLKKDKPDQRYVNFLIDILTPSDIPSNPKFPDDEIKIVSWNYDNQIELACNKLNLGEDFFKDSIKIEGTKTEEPKTEEPITEEPKKTNLITLNGSCDSKNLISKTDFKYLISKIASKDSESEGAFNIPILQNAYEETMHELAYRIWLTDSYVSEKIKFAWEHTIAYDDNFFKHSNLHKKKHIVVIGYSFPFANRSIDEKILLDITRNYQMHRLVVSTDIHIQVPEEEEFENIVDRIKSLLSNELDSKEIKEKINFYHQTDRKNFFIPNAL